MRTTSQAGKSLDTQKQKIKHALDAGCVIDLTWAWNKVGCSKLSSRIGEMERDGMIPPVYRYRKVTKNGSHMIYSRKPIKQYENKGLK